MASKYKKQAIVTDEFTADRWVAATPCRIIRKKQQHWSLLSKIFNFQSVKVHLAQVLHLHWNSKTAFLQVPQFTNSSCPKTGYKYSFFVYLLCNLTKKSDNRFVLQSFSFIYLIIFYFLCHFLMPEIKKKKKKDLGRLWEKKVKCHGESLSRGRLNNWHWDIL